MLRPRAMGAAQNLRVIRNGWRPFHRHCFPIARHKSKRDVEHLVASLVAQPDIQSTLRRVPSTRAEARVPMPTRSSPLLVAPSLPAPPAEQEPSCASLVATSASSSRRPIVAPLGTDRYLLKITLSKETHKKLERARDLLRHAVPDGDPAIIVERALTLLVEDLERRKVAATSSPREKAVSEQARRGRHVPAMVKRAVWARDEGRCAFVGARGRCKETGFLEFHHVVPFAEGGTTDAGNLQLRCRAHNQYEAVRQFGSTAGPTCSSAS